MDAKDTTDILVSCFTVLGIIVGALWAYFNYFKGRIYRPRLEPKVDIVAKKDGRATYLPINACLKNVGLSKLDVEQKGSGLQIYIHERESESLDIEEADWERIATFPVFEDHRWIEPNETIEDEHLIKIQNGHNVAVKCLLRIVSRKIEWKYHKILYL